MLFKLSLKNQQKSIKDYSIYFFTLILGVCIFYIFNAIDAQTAMMEVSNTTSEVIDTMNTVISMMSIIVSFILGFLIVYASQFLIKKRKREFGLYMTLGMRKKDISKILLFETLSIGIISLLIGLIVGIGLSQFMSLFVANMFKANMKKFVFVVSYQSIFKTIFYYTLIYIVVLVMNTLVIRTAKLIDLMSAHAKKENIHLKNPIVSLTVFIIACICLGIAYYNVTIGRDKIVTQSALLIQICLGILGTFLIFWSISGFALNILKKRTNIYYKQLNSFVMGEVSHQINTTVVAGSIICLLLFCTICMLSSAFTLKNYKEDLVKELAPIDASLSKNMEEDQRSIEGILVNENIDTTLFANVVNLYAYEFDDVTRYSVLGAYGEEILEADKSFDVFMGDKVPIIYEHDYNQVARMYNKDTLSLGNNGYIIVANYPTMVEFFNNGLKNNQTIQINGKILEAKQNTCQDGFLMMSYSENNMGFIVVSDETEMNEENRVMNYYLIDGIQDNMKSLLENNDHHLLDISTQVDIYDDSIGSSGLVIFIALYLGIVFMISGSAILALKEMSDAIDSKNKYMILRKIGTNEKEINKALFKQMAIFFGFPLLLSIIHSIFGIQVCQFILNVYDTSSIFPSLIITSGIIIFIYGGYFIVSYLCCKRLIK